MLVTKNAAELCVLLISELYGQLPSRIFEVLLSKGISNVRRLGQDTGMHVRLVRHGLAVLVQQNLVYHQTDPDTLAAQYEANSEVAYNLVRTGKIIDIIRRNYGEEAKGLVHSVLLNGHMTVIELMEIRSKGGSNGLSQIKRELNGAFSETSAAEEEDVDHTQQTFELLAHLIAVGILEPLDAKMLQTPQDMRLEIEREIMRGYPAGLRGQKQKSEFQARVRDALKSIQYQSKALKANLEADHLQSSGAKRRKLTNGSRVEGSSAVDRDKLIDPETILRVNYQKCLVELRNQRLTQYAEDAIGPVSAQVYGALLAALGRKISQCQIDMEDESQGFSDPPSVTTLEVFEHLRPSVDVFHGIGKCDPGSISAIDAEKIQGHAPGYEDGENGNGTVSDNDEEDETNGDVHMSNGVKLNGVHEEDTKIVHSENGTRETKVKFADRVPTRAERIQQMRQHLLILAESNLQFIRHSGVRDQGEWTVDFHLLLPKLQLFEIDTLIEQAFGRQGLRLVKILRAKGKVDDKTLTSLALMKKGDVYIKMTEMELKGYLEVQEVPRDNNRTASRTLFLWFFDQERTLTRILDDTYKSMSRHIQRLEVERRKKKNVLSVVERKDVQGMEEEKLRGDIYNEYREFLDIESRLLGQVGRLDDLVSVFRDF